jgi:hypothetical protein
VARRRPLPKDLLSPAGPGGKDATERSENLQELLRPFLGFVAERPEQLGEQRPILDDFSRWCARVAAMIVTSRG